MVEHVFNNCSMGVKPVPFPDGTVGKCVVIMDKDTGNQWLYPMPDDAAKEIARLLNGGVAVSNALEIPPTNGRGPGH